MKQDVNIDQLMAETWLTVTMLKKGAQASDGPALYDKCVKQVESVREALARAGYDDASIGHISYAQCALLDEAVMNRKPEKSEDRAESRLDEGQITWRKAPLQARFFGSLRAGEDLWVRIEDILRQPAPVNAVLVCYHRVIALGFQGLYSLNPVNLAQRDVVIKALAERVSPPEAGLSLTIYRTGRHRWSLMRSVWFWIVLAVVMTGAVWWGGHLWLQTLISTQLPELPR